MFKRKLAALGYSAHTDKKFDIKDEQQVRKVVVWLEDQHIRHYTIEARRPLKQIDESEWPSTFSTYLSDLKCPVETQPLAARLDWLLGVAVQLEYAEKSEQYAAHTAAAAEARRAAVPTAVSDNPLDLLDHTSQEYRDGVTALADALGLPSQHPDHLVTLAAVSHVVQTKLSEAALKTPVAKPNGWQFPLSATDSGFETGDAKLNKAGTALRLLYIQDLRQLQTSINECVVACQKVTANPKTDSRLGKVGRKD